MEARIIAIVNHKGGTGKTTTAISLGKCLAMLGKKILLVDMDAQANLSFSLGIPEPENILGNFLKNESFSKEDLYHKEGMDVLPTNHFLSEYEFTFIKEGTSFKTLKSLLSEVSGIYDFIILDCPPAVSFLTANALVAARAVLIPMQMDVLSIQGLNQILYSVNEVKEELNPRLETLGILPVLVDSRRQLTREAQDYINTNYKVRIFENSIRQTVRVAEAPSYGKSIMEYAPDSKASKDYKAFATEFLQAINAD